ncbi:MAG: Beta-mannosidase B [Claussenomyces sp. TS43310]|nr:MAG: Beta-mannosidase B [Claussenomyces sp. TS43310]
MSHRATTPIDKNWTFKQADDSAAEFRPVAQFPSNIHLDLLANDRIPDPFIGKNEVDVQWVGETAWIYKTTFDAPDLAALTRGAKAVLAFDGLDTYATVRFNGSEVLKTESMFVPERVDVTDHVKAGENVLDITFESAYLKGWKLVEKYPEHKWGCWNGDNSRLAVRKAQYHWGWDWGPALMTCGPWRPINLEIYESRIADLYFTTSVDASLRSAEIIAKADIEGSSASQVKFIVSLNGHEVCSSNIKVEHGHASDKFQLDRPELWYPNRYGKQPLYSLAVTLLHENREIDAVSKKLGLRRARLVQQPMVDQPGTTFFFEVNNLPIFCGGSDWIPADSFIPRISAQRYHDWVKLVADGNQMMIRVWGGGIYEEQAFYDACDELGILVWQDFMFGCGNYPAFPEYLALVEREAEANVKLLRHHPSIVIWAGNNEDYQYRETEKLTYDHDNKDEESWLQTDFPARYIYEKILADCCKELIPDTYYHFGSPWGAGRDTQDPTVGDIHQWNVWHGTQERYQDFDKLVGRFVSEFGMEAFPNIKTIDSFLPLGKADPDRFPQSSTVDFHNKAAGHERRLALYLVENLRYAPDPIEQFVYCTQLLQAECLASAYRLWRRQWRGPGREHCGGALVWQINDCWPVTSWSIADYHLRPKHAYFAIKREMAPLTCAIARTEHVTPRDRYTRAHIRRQHVLDIWASNLSLRDVTVDVVVTAWHLLTGAETFRETVATQLLLPGNRSTEIVTLPVPVRTPDSGEEMAVVVAAYLLVDGQQVARYVNWPDPLKYAHLPKPRQLTAQLSPDETRVDVSAEVPVKGVALECEDDGVVFGDNCVDVVPGEVVAVAVKGALKESEIATRYLGMV